MVFFWKAGASLKHSCTLRPANRKWVFFVYIYIIYFLIWNMLDISSSFLCDPAGQSPVPSIIDRWDQIGTFDIGPFCFQVIHLAPTCWQRWWQTGNVFHTHCFCSNCEEVSLALPYPTPKFRQIFRETSFPSKGGGVPFGRKKSAKQYFDLCPKPSRR